MRLLEVAEENVDFVLKIYWAGFALLVLAMVLLSTEVKGLLSLGRFLLVVGAAIGGIAGCFHFLFRLVLYAADRRLINTEAKFGSMMLNLAVFQVIGGVIGMLLAPRGEVLSHFWVGAVVATPVGFLYYFWRNRVQ